MYVCRSTNSSVLAEYDKIREISSGSFGEVWLYRQKKDKNLLIYISSINDFM